MKTLIRRLIHATGFDIRRLRDPCAAWSYSLSPEEAADVAEICRTLDQQSNEKTGWLEPQVVRNYLGARRIGLYHLVIEKCLAHGLPFDGKDIADVGSGPGYLLRLLSQRFHPASLTGYDASPTVNQLATYVCPEARIEESDIFDVEHVDYDIVCNTEVLEHMRQPGPALLQMRKLVRPGGALVLTVPNGRFDQTPAKEVFGHGQAYLGHINFWSPESWPVFLETTLPGCQVHTELLASGHNFAIVHVA